VRYQTQLTAEVSRVATGWRERLGIRIVQALAEPSREVDSIHEILCAIVAETGIANAAIRLKSGDNYPYYTYRGFSQEFVAEETDLVTIKAEGECVPPGDGSPALACLCGRVLSGRTDPTESFFSRGGSFFSPRFQKLVSIVDDSRTGPLKGRCVFERFETLALIPLARATEIIGLLQLSDPRPDLLSIDDIAFLEQLGASVSVAVDQHRYWAENERWVSEADKNTKEKFCRAVRAIPEAIGVASLEDGTFLDVNDIFLEVMGVRREQVIGRTAEELGIWAAPEARRTYFERLRKERRLRGFEAKMRVNSRQIRDFLISGEVAEIEGRPYSLNLFLDVTEQKQGEVARQNLQNRLFDAQKDDAVQTLAAGVSHDFNNLLGGIMGGLSLMEIKVGSHTKLHQEIEEIMKLVERGANLTNQLLGFARLGKNKSRPMDLNKLTEKTAEMFGRTRTDIAICTRYARGPQVIDADGTQIEQVFLNLLVNAGQAMPEGGDLTVLTEPIELSAEQALAHDVAPGKYVKLSVTDTGVGMDAETRERIFEPFFATKIAGHGTGLGLASVLGIVKNHGGLVTVGSELGEGSTFSVLLPVCEQPVLCEPHPSLSPRRGSETILVVDDEAHIVKTSKLLLEAMGYEVLTASSGQEAVEVYRGHQEKIALIILDMTMPGMSGGQTFDALRTVSPRAKVLLASGYGIEGQASAILDRGCDGFIQKPFSVATLSGKLKELL
jgi:two-component system, cell cycle sensor histidine kinase and response regulator CckA